MIFIPKIKEYKVMKKSNMINVPVEFAIDALQARYDEVENLWGCDASAALWEQALQSVAERGLDKNVTSPSIYVENYLINGEFVSKIADVEHWLDSNQPNGANDLDEAWEEYCQDNALLYSDEYACIQF